MRSAATTSSGFLSTRRTNASASVSPSTVGASLSLGGAFQAARRWFGLLSARRKLPFGQGPKLAQRVGHAVAAEAEAVLDVQGQVHPLQAIEPESLELRLGGILFGRKRPLQLLFDHLVDRPDRGRPDLGQIDPVGL